MPDYEVEMSGITLETLASRVEALERIVHQTNLRVLSSGAVYYEGTGDWKAAFQAVGQIQNYDDQANRDMNACEK